MALAEPPVPGMIYDKEKLMEYIYSALLLHAAGQKVTEDAVTKIVAAAGAKADAAKAKALVASLEGVNIADAIKNAAVAAAPVAVAAPAEAKKEEKAEDTAKKAEEAAAGLGALFG